MRLLVFQSDKPDRVHPQYTGTATHPAGSTTGQIFLFFTGSFTFRHIQHQMWVSDGKVAFILPEVCKIILFSCLLYVLFFVFWRGEYNLHRWVSHPKGDESHWCTQAPPTPGANQLIMWAGLCYCERLNYWFVRTFRLIAVRARASSPATMNHSCCFSHRANAVITLLCHSYKCSNNCTCTKVMLSGLFFLP